MGPSTQVFLGVSLFFRNMLRPKWGHLQVDTVYARILLTVKDSVGIKIRY
jgi:hypothetical protein